MFEVLDFQANGTCTKNEMVVNEKIAHSVKKMYAKTNGKKCKFNEKQIQSLSLIFFRQERHSRLFPDRKSFEQVSRIDFRLQPS
jgi:hypothetical protein